MSLASSRNIVVRTISVRPDFVALHRLAPKRYPFILESAAHGTAIGRYDVLFGFPQDEISLWADDDGLANKHDFLSALDARLETPNDAVATAYVGHDLPFRGGWFVFLAYELAGQIEPTLQLPLATDMPTAYAVRIPVGIIYDHLEQRCLLVAETKFEHHLDEVERDMHALESRPVTERALLHEALKEDPPQDYLDAVQTAKQHIIDGDVFQANLSRAWRGQVIDTWHDAEMYRRLRKTNPGPFAGMAVWGDLAIISSSPERMISLQNGRIDTRPIAGTRPRGTQARDDEALSRELIGHPKERAEHIMLIDLERNDLGRVCKPGSVEVNELMVIESYAHVHHIVSNVRGQLRDDVTPGEAIRATFPGGTITGCPKVRCMEIIASLEGVPRGPYTGSIGYLNHDGSGDLNILIRTIVRNGNELSLRAGAGIVFDSEPLNELAETGVKAKGLLRAIMANSAHD